MRTAEDILNAKGHEVWSVSPEATVLDALRLMAEKKLGAVLVLDGHKLLGILSERDYARKVVLAGLASKNALVSQVMTSDVVCVSPDKSIEECMALMTDKRLRHLPVIRNDRVVGVVSIGDLVKAVIADQEFMIDQLRSYIAG